MHPSQGLIHAHVQFTPGGVSVRDTQYEGLVALDSAILRGWLQVCVPGSGVLTQLDWREVIAVRWASLTPLPAALLRRVVENLGLTRDGFHRARAEFAYDSPTLLDLDLDRDGVYEVQQTEGWIHLKTEDRLMSLPPLAITGLVTEPDSQPSGAHPAR